MEVEGKGKAIDLVYETIRHAIRDPDFDVEDSQIIRHALESFQDMISMTAAVHVLRNAANMNEDQDTQETLKRLAIGIRGLQFNSELNEKGIVDVLSDLEHKQWMKWSQTVAPEVSEERRVRWKMFWVPYEQLDEATKGFDRLWAMRVMSVIEPVMERIRGEQYERFLGYVRHSMDLFFQKQFEQDIFESYRNQVLADILNQVQQESLGEGVGDREESSN